MGKKAKVIAEKQASKFRSENGLDVDEPLTLDRLLMRLGVLTVFRPISTHFSGMAIKTSDADRYILVNSSHPRGKQHFTICHELYHLYVQQDFNYKVCDTGNFNAQGDEYEYFADLFAANLLMPESAIKEFVPQEEMFDDQIKLETVLRLEHYLGSSRIALLYRLKTLGFISNDTINKYKRNVKKSARLHGKSTSLYEPDHRKDHIGDYGDLARSLFESNKISEGHYSGLLTDLGIDLSKEEDLKDV